MRAILPLACIAASILASHAVHAEMVVGGYGPDAATGHPLRTFARSATGAAATPVQEISGSATLLHEPAHGAYEPNERVIYVSDFGGRAVRVYPASASGNVAPLRVLNPGIMGQARTNAPVPEHGELGVIVSNCCIATWPLTASGDTAPLRLILWGGGSDSSTQLNNPIHLVYLPGTDEYAVVDYAPGTATRQIVFHHASGNGYVSPSRLLTGPHVANAIGLAHDRERHWLYVLIHDQADGSGTQARRINVFDEDAAGDAAPSFVVEGGDTQLGLPDHHYSNGLGYDPYLRRLMVSSGFNSQAEYNRIVVFDVRGTPNGNLAPVQVITGTAASPYTVGTPFAVPNQLFEDGFEGD